MPTYMIHTMPKRLWYVDEFLVPSMMDQGIAQSDILIYNDNKESGALRACLDSFSQVGRDTEGTWHLQDDVVISSKFAEQTERYDSCIICAFASRYDKDKPVGSVKPKDMWFSFPCIRIPNFLAKNFVVWFKEEMQVNPVYKQYWKDGVNDDLAFRLYINSLEHDVPIRNLAPNLVNHIDYLIGGQVRGGVPRDGIVTSAYWEENDIVEELKEQVIIYNEKKHNKLL